MKGFKKIVGLGVAIWALSLVWPEINLVLGARLMIGLVLVLAVAVLVYILNHHIDHHHGSDGADQDHHKQPGQDSRSHLNSPCSPSLGLHQRLYHPNC